jgi:hypothetical protein
VQGRGNGDGGGEAEEDVSNRRSAHVSHTTMK